MNAGVDRMFSVKPTKCRKCPAPVLWIPHERTGRPMPLNAEPHPDGNVELYLRADNTRVAKVFGPGNALDEKRAAGTPLYLNHFADCPFAKTFRKKP